MILKSPYKLNCPPNAMSDLWEQFRNYFLKNTTLIHQTGTLDKKIRTVVHLLLTGRPFNRIFAAQIIIRSFG